MERWIIVKGQERFGPWEPFVVRQALRMGHIALDSSAAPEGSNQFVPLSDVEALFETGYQLLSDDAREESLIDQALALSPQEWSALNARGSINVDRRSARRANQPEAPRKPTTEGGASRYAVLDPAGKSLGLFSAREILELAHHNQIDPRMSVRRIDTQRTLPILQFVQTLGGPQAGAASPHANPNYQPQSQANNTALLWGTIVALVIGFGGVLFREQIFPPSQERPVSAGPRTEAVRESVPGPVAEQGITPAIPSEARPEPGRDSISIFSQKPINAPATGDDSDAKGRKPATQAKTAKSAVKGAVSTLVEAKSREGEVIILGPLTFKPQELAACQAKCTLLVRDKGQAVIKLVFFKAAFGAQLIGKQGGVYVKGRLAGITLYPIMIM